MRRSLEGSMVVLTLVHAVGIAPGLAQEQDSRKGALVHDKVIAGSPKDFMEVRHIVLKGSNEEIGQALATIAKERYGVRLAASTDRLRTGVERRYIKEHYPILFERMKGIASAFGARVDDDARPYVIELHPDRGYASLALCAYDLLSGVLDGINSEGLTVAVLADYELKPEFPIDPAEEGGVGLDELQTLRMLLDTCASALEAKEALLLTKQYYGFIPMHYLVADRHGNAFVWEYSHAHNREYMIENPGKPLITTNFRLHRYLEGKNPPSAERAKRVCARYCALAERIAAAPGKLTVNFIKETHKAVDITMPAPLFGLVPPARTLWHSLYVPERRAMQVSFYLKDEPNPEARGKTRIVRSEYLEFALKSPPAGKE
jgi:hypothetical protein